MQMTHRFQNEVSKLVLEKLTLKTELDQKFKAKKNNEKT